MRGPLLVVFLLSGAIISARAQQGCDEAGDPFDALERALSRVKTCAAAVEIWERRCPTGFNAQTELTPVIIGKCEKTFLAELSPAAQKRYTEEMQLCAYRYARQDGTMWLDFAVGCQLDVAERFAAKPALANQLAPRASFDCDKAQTAMEKAICSHKTLGHADIVLSRVYDAKRKELRKDRVTLVQDQKAWWERLPSKCGVTDDPLSPESLNCVRTELELRFTALDSCTDSITECLQSASNEGAAALTASPRASFDCEKPSTSLESMICADARLGQADIKLAHAYRDADKTMAAQHEDLVESERQWLGFVSQTCSVGQFGRIPPWNTRLCLQDGFEKRIAQLVSCPQKEPPERMSCLNDFQPLQNK
jgi:uncharacterized protein